MTRLNQLLLLLCCCTAIMVSCKDPYMPDLSTNNTNILVVEGYIDGADTTMIQLSRVRMISARDTASKQLVTDASVTVESESGNIFPLYNIGLGKYAALYYFDPTQKYLLNIVTPGQHRYRSDLLTMKQSPPIDSVNLGIDKEGARIMVNTHDETGNTTYYRWRWNDTWEFHSTYYAEVSYNKDKQQIEPLTENMYVCWQSDHSKSILVNSSAKLKKDEVRNFPIHHIPFGDYRLSVLYSIYVKQYAMDSLGFDYYSLLKKNSENVGSLFDPQPNILRGNIHSVNDSSEIVVGYVGAGRSSSKRAFFRIPWNYRQNCPDPISVLNNKDTMDLYYSILGYLPISPQTFGIDTLAYISGNNFCVDCRMRGTNKKPIFWP